MNTTTTPKSTSPKPKRNPVVLILLASALIGYAGGWVGGQQGSKESAKLSAATTQQIISTEGQAIAAVAKDVGESVVSIDTTATTKGQDFFGFSQNYQSQGAGTGVIVGEDIIVTNKHVVPAGTTSVKVTLSDGTSLDATVQARDPRNDIAFIKITDKKGKTLKIAKLADSSQIQVGDKVVAIGNALGEFQNTVTSGIIAGYGRNISAGGDGTGSEDLTNLIQTDAAINRGNSGGPLVNLSGEVLGINTAITGSDNGQSLGFSIPINDIKNQIESVLRSGKIERPYLGIRYRAIDDKYAFVYNLPVKRGAYLPPTDLSGQSAIVPDSPADKAGLKEKDIITKIDDKEITDKNDLVSILGSYKVGDTVKLTVLRDGKEQMIDVKLEVSPTN